MKKERRIISAFLILALLISFVPKGNVFADTVSYTVELTIGSKTVYINGSPKEMDVAPYIDPKTNRTLVPVRFVAEGLGGKVSWQNREKFVGVLVGNRKVGMWIGKSTAEVTSRPASYEEGYDVIVKKEMDQPPVISNGRTMIPLRFVSESVGADVQWDGSTKKITITLSYEPLKMLDMVWALSFDRYITKTGTTTYKDDFGNPHPTDAFAGWIIPTDSPYAYDSKNKAFFTIGFDIFKSEFLNNGVDGSPHVYFPDSYGSIYLIKFDALTGIVVNKTKILDGKKDWIDAGNYGVRRRMYLAYNNGYLYVGGFSSLYLRQINNEPYVKGQSPVYITFRKLDAETYSVIWSKRFNLQDTLFGKDLYLDDTRAFDIGIKDLSPLFFSQDGSVFMVPLYLAILVPGTYKGIKFSGNIHFATYIGFDAKTGNIIWKQVHDGFKNLVVADYQVAVYKDVAVFRESPGIEFLCWDKKNPGDSYYSYQADILWNLTQKLVKENLTDKGIDIGDYVYGEQTKNVGIKGTWSYPLKLLGINIKTGKTVWEKTFLSIGQDTRPYIFYENLSQLYMQDGILYVPATVYDPEAEFKFAAQIVKIRADSGEMLPLSHNVFKHQLPDWTKLPFAEISMMWGNQYSPFLYTYNGNTYIIPGGWEAYRTAYNNYAIQVASTINNFVARNVNEFLKDENTIEKFNGVFNPYYAYLRIENGDGVEHKITNTATVSGAQWMDICRSNHNDFETLKSIDAIYPDLGLIIVRLQWDNSGFIALNVE